MTDDDQRRIKDIIFLAALRRRECIVGDLDKIIAATPRPTLPRPRALDFSEYPKRVGRTREYQRSEIMDYLEGIYLLAVAP